jgi:hypothetical protein
MRTITKVAVLAALFTALFQTAAAQSVDDIADRSSQPLAVERNLGKVKSRLIA